jgi:hypothetical protein
MSSNNDFKKDFDSSMGKVAKIFHEELDNLQNSEGVIFPKRIKGKIQLYVTVTENTALDGLCKIQSNKMEDSQKGEGQKVVFKVASFENGQIHLLEGDYENYPDAEKSIEALPNGTYQVQKVFVKY